MSAPVKLPPNIKRSLEKLMDLGVAKWPDFATWTTPGKKKPLRQHTINVIRHLKRAGYVESVERPADQPYTVYKLSPAGIRAVISGNKESA